MSLYESYNDGLSRLKVHPCKSMFMSSWGVSMTAEVETARHYEFHFTREEAVQLADMLREAVEKSAEIEREMEEYHKREGKA